jgi:hypothetical protein
MGICLFLSVAVIGLTVYGSNVGNFVISLQENSQVGLSLSETADFRDSRTLLSARGIRDMTNCTKDNIPAAELHALEGSNNDLTNFFYLSYTFFVRNQSSFAVNYLLAMDITKTTRGVESSLRIMIIKDGKDVIYAKAAKDGGPEQNLGQEGLSLYSVESFLSDTLVFERTETGFAAGSQHRYTVILWLEGWDPETTDAIKGGTMRLDMRFAGYA